MSNTVTVSPAFTSICLNIHSTTPPTQVNHLSHFLLTLELLPSLLETASSTGDGRIIFVSSNAHKYGTFNPENMNGEQSYSRGRFYGNSKLYNVSAHFVTCWYLSKHQVFKKYNISAVVKLIMYHYTDYRLWQRLLCKGVCRMWGSQSPPSTLEL